MLVAARLFFRLLDNAAITFFVSRVDAGGATDVIKRENGQFSVMHADMGIFAAARQGTQDVHIAFQVVVGHVVGVTVRVVEVVVAGKCARKEARLAIAVVFAAEFGEEVYAGEQGVGILADATMDIGTGKQCQPVGVHLQAGDDNAVCGVGFVDGPQRQAVPAHEFGDTFAHGKGRGNIGVENAARTVLSFFGMARRGDAGFAIDGFAGRRATFFDVVHECSGKEDVPRFFVQRLVVRLLKQRGDNHFGVGEDVAFTVPFGILRPAGHVCQPRVGSGEVRPIGVVPGVVVREGPHVQLLR